MNAIVRRFAVGAEVHGHAVHFRVWAPERKAIAVVEPASFTDRPEYGLLAEGNGYFSGVFPQFKAGDLYAFRLDDGQDLYPDPASRSQPRGPHGPSQVIDASGFPWHDAKFAEDPAARVIYELHIGTFTLEGTYRAAAARLGDLVDVGVTMIELMPVNGFPGRFGWGYDGVNAWAPLAAYGSPDDLRSLIQTAHDLGLAVILDVVYNHFGPDGNYLGQYSRAYFSDDYQCEWGKALNFDGQHSAGVREYVCENARYWLTEFHFDGLRLDATQALFDQSEPHIIADLVRAARAGGEALGKRVFIAAENEPQLARLARPEWEGGFGVDALWNDDFHHSAMVTLTGRRPAYYGDYRGTAQELISALKWGYLFQGQHYYWQRQRRGTPALDLKAENFIVYIQNHDQIANSVTGERIDKLSRPASLRAMTTLMLLSPPTPMLFQGQEFGASSPFFYFADQHAELALTADRERRKFLAQFPGSVSEAAQRKLTHPSDPETFARSKLDWSEREKNGAVVRFHRDLLALRKGDPAIRQRRADSMHGCVLTERALGLRFFCAEGDRLLLVNFGEDCELRPVAEPLLAAPDERGWHLLFCSEDAGYGGQGYEEPWVDGKFILTAHSALLFGPGPATALPCVATTRPKR